MLPYILICRVPSSPGILPAHAGFFSQFPSLGRPAVLLCEDTSKVRAVWPRVQLCWMPWIVMMAPGIVDVRLLTVVCVSSSSDRCLIVSHQVCRVVTFDFKKLTVVERWQSNHCVNKSVNVFRLMQERK